MPPSFGFRPFQSSSTVKKDRKQQRFSSSSCSSSSSSFSSFSFSTRKCSKSFVAATAADDSTTRDDCSETAHSMATAGTAHLFSPTLLPKSCLKITATSLSLSSSSQKQQKPRNKLLLRKVILKRSVRFAKKEIVIENAYNDGPVELSDLYWSPEELKHRQEHTGFSSMDDIRPANAYIKAFQNAQKVLFQQSSQSLSLFSQQIQEQHQSDIYSALRNGRQTGYAGSEGYHPEYKQTRLFRMKQIRRQILKVHRKLFEQVVEGKLLDMNQVDIELSRVAQSLTQPDTIWALFIGQLDVPEEQENDGEAELMIVSWEASTLR